MNRVDLKERIAIDYAFTPEERNFLLDAINAMPETEGAELHDPGNYMGRIEQLWAYLSVDDGGRPVRRADGRSHNDAADRRRPAAPATHRADRSWRRQSIRQSRAARALSRPRGRGDHPAMTHPFQELQEEITAELIKAA